MMINSRIICDKEYIIGEIDKKMYGSFLEHMGRVIYSGVYEPENEVSDENGFRMDVVDAVKKMGVRAVRYPGGNFVSAYCWEDGVGPKEERPKRLELAWKAIETNEFGTNEFMKWSQKTGIEPIFTVNLGLRGIKEAVEYLEYCNIEGNTKFSDMRKSHGVEQPYHIKYWCLGNEMDGAWQIGHKTAREYGRLAAEVGRAMKIVDPEIELIVCGSSLSTMPTYPQWDLEVLEETYDIVDYIALHQYYGGQEKGTKEFLAQTLDMENYIKTLRSVVQFVKQKRRSSKDVKFSIDEWGVWALPGDSVNKEIDKNPWQMAPAISEQIYTMEDALLFAGMMIVMLKNCDVIKIACQSLLTNVSACIMTERNGGIWLQTIYYPFFYFANYARGVVLDTRKKGDSYGCTGFEMVPYLDEVMIWNQEKKELVFFLINKSETDQMKVEISLKDFEVTGVIEAIVLAAEHKKMTNENNHNAVVPKKADYVNIIGNMCYAELEPLSFNMVRLSV